LRDVEANGAAGHMTFVPEVDRAITADIGAVYLHAHDASRDPRVVAAYRQLETETDGLFTAAVIATGPRAVRIAFTRCPQPYRSDRELIAAVRAGGVLEITSAAVSSTRLHPLLGCELGGAFDRFRAVHDLIGHVRAGLGFALRDELRAWRIQDRQYGMLARKALATEILAINCARAVLGAPPDQKAVLLRPESVLGVRDAVPQGTRELLA
jgi:hypothetical protein